MVSEAPLLDSPETTSLMKLFRSFWQTCFRQSDTGNFSFWLGRRHVVGITGAAARKVFFDTPSLDFVSGAIILPFGIHFWPPIHDIFKPGFAKGVNNTYFLRRLADSMTSKQLNKYFPRMLKETRDGYDYLLRNNPKRVIKPTEIWRTVFRQNCRLVFSDEVVDNADLAAVCGTSVDNLLHTFSHYNVPFPWLPSPSYIKRRLARYRLLKVTTAVVDKRIASESPSVDDPLQTAIENGDKREHMIEYFTSVMFISTTNAHAIAGQILNIMAIHTDWQEKIYQEIVAAADVHSKDKTAPLVDRLGAIPLEAWENSFPSFELCLTETIRMWTSFGVTRLNTSPDTIPIPGSDEVVPGNTFVIYNSTEVNFSEKLYPNPTKFDPERFTEGREEFKQEPYGCQCSNSNILVHFVAN